MDNTMLAWAAGFMDGEGSFGVVVEKRGTCLIRAQAANIDVRPLYELKEMFGGAVCTHAKATARTRTSYQWMVTGRKAIACMEALLPHFKVKREQVELVLEFSNATCEL